MSANRRSISSNCLPEAGGCKDRSGGPPPPPGVQRSGSALLTDRPHQGQTDGPAATAPEPIYLGAPTTETETRPRIRHEQWRTNKGKKPHKNSACAASRRRENAFYPLLSLANQCDRMIGHDFESRNPPERKPTGVLSRAFRTSVTPSARIRARRPGAKFAEDGSTPAAIFVPVQRLPRSDQTARDCGHNKPTERRNSLLDNRRDSSTISSVV